jgi:hypothetical protein
MRIVLSALLLTLALSSCASGGATGGQRRNPNVITNAELRQTDAEGLTAFQAIQRMRPQWLRGRGVDSFGGGAALPKVLVEEAPFGEVDDLRSMDAYDVDEIRFLSAADATTRFGTGYPAGAILVSLR